MKPMTLLICMSLLLGSAMAVANDNERIERFWQRQGEAKVQLIQAWKQADNRAYSRAVLQIGKYETYLLASGRVRPDDPRLVGGLAVNMKSHYDYPIFAYQVFKHELKRLIGFSPEPRNVFLHRRLRIHERP